MAVREKRFDEMAWKAIANIRKNKDRQFIIDELTARRDFLRLRLRHEPAIKKIYIDAADNVAQRLRQLKPTIGDLTRRHLTELEKTLRQEAERIKASTEALMREGTSQAYNLAARPIDNHFLRAVQQADVGLSAIRLQHGFADVNSAAVESMWARTKNGMRISERIWSHASGARDNIRKLLRTGIAQGRDAVQVARDLERYVRVGARTLSKDYHNMMWRMGTRLPKDLSYEALRLVRTEYTRAFTEGVYSRGRTNPSYKGSRWNLSDAHPEPDVCDDFAQADLYGRGPGVYPKGEEPVNPHPQCLCYPTPVVEDIPKVVEQLQQWRNDPSSQPELEEWYNEVYRPISLAS